MRRYSRAVGVSAIVVVAAAFVLTAIAGSAAASGRSSRRATSSAAAALIQRLLSTPPKVTPALLAAGTNLVRVNPATGKLEANQTSPAHCHFAASTKPRATPGQIGDAHPSTYLRKQERVEAIKVNSYIVCDHPVQALANETRLYKTGKFLFIFPVSHLQAQTTTKNAGKTTLANLGTFRECTNRKKTTWYGNAVGISEEGGQVYEGVGASPHKQTYSCGT